MNTKTRIIEVAEYDEKWPTQFQSESGLIESVLGSQIVALHHIGSTAVPGLKAKPIIDILLEVNDITALDAFNSQMQSIGYIPKGEYGIPERRFYHKGLVSPTHHIHAFNEESLGALRHLVFRDYLIAHPHIAEQYGELKTECAHQCGNDIDKYCLGKENFVKNHERLALEWFECQHGD